MMQPIVDRALDVSCKVHCAFSGTVGFRTSFLFLTLLLLWGALFNLWIVGRGN